MLGFPESFLIPTNPSDSCLYKTSLSSSFSKREQPEEGTQHLVWCLVAKHNKKSVSTRREKKSPHENVGFIIFIR